MSNYLKPKTFHELVVIDDLFPHSLSPWRTEEYNGYLRNYPTAIVYSSGSSLEYIKETRSFASILAEYFRRYPEMRGRVQVFHPSRKLRGKLGYIMFLHNAYRFLEVVEKNKLPFILQLWPGGNFKIDDPESDRQLALVCKSPYLQHIIATQNITRAYLINKGFFPPEKITYIYGAVLPMTLFLDSPQQRLTYPDRKPTLDICFVAGKYMPEGRDKGYDLFIAAAKMLAPQFEKLRFHVVGPYDETDIPVEELAGKIHFYGRRPTEWFLEFYAKMDAIVSPNRSFTLTLGGFDGFPTGCCMEAGAAGVAIFCTDDLKQNTGFTDGEDMVFLEPNAEDVAQKVANYLTNYDRLVALGKGTRSSVRYLFDDKTRLQARLDVINAQLALLPDA